MSKKRSTLKAKAKKLWRRKVLRASKEETTCLIESPDKEVTIVNSSSSELEGEKVKKKKKTLMKRIGKMTVTACRYIGMGAATMSGPSMAAHSMYSHHYPYYGQRYGNPYYDLPPEYSYGPPEFVGSMPYCL
ncbi:hypothetical protein HDE_05440 [Halotydeus destructor]|nr:hypothetical protein HDE_05440 [Halotydeus destructor]